MLYGPSYSFVSMLFNCDFSDRKNYLLIVASEKKVSILFLFEKKNLFDVSEFTPFQSAIDLVVNICWGAIRMNKYYVFFSFLYIRKLFLT